MEAFLGTILLWPMRRAPYGWMFCQGQTLPVSQYQALFSLIGFTYGGDGKDNFKLPDLQGRFPIGVGQSPTPNSTMHQLGVVTGVEQITTTIISTGGGVLTAANLPGHSHTFTGTPCNVNVNVNGSADLSKVTSSVPATTDLSGGGQNNIPSSTLVLGPAKIATTAGTACSVYCNPSTTPTNNIKVLSNQLSGNAPVTATGTTSITPAGTVTSNTTTPTGFSLDSVGTLTYSTMSPCLPINFIICVDNGLYPDLQ